VAASVLATAFVSVRLHLNVAALRYRLWSLEEDRARTERDLRLARAELEAAKAPRRLMERWAEMRREGTVVSPAATAVAGAPAAAAPASAEGDDATPVPPPPPPPIPQDEVRPVDPESPEREGQR